MFGQAVSEQSVPSDCYAKLSEHAQNVIMGGGEGLIKKPISELLHISVSKRFLVRNYLNGNECIFLCK